MTSAGRARAVRPFDWAFPPVPVHREVLCALPHGQQDTPSTAASDRPPLLFVHGMCHGAWCYAEHWLPRAAELGFPAYAVSLRGHGASGGYQRRRRTMLRDYVHDVVQAAVQLPHQAVLIGHSLGAVVVSRALARYPARAGVLLAPVGVDSGLGSSLRLARRHPVEFGRAVVGRPVRFAPEDLFSAELDPADTQRHLARLAPDSPLVQYQITLHRRPDPPLGAAPVLVVGVRGDGLVPAREVRRTARRYGTHPVWLDGTGHDLMLDRGWQHSLELILAWVERLAAGTATSPGGADRTAR